MPYQMSKDIFGFYGRNYTEEVTQFLDKHTHRNFPNSENTFRRSAMVPTKWMKQMNRNEVKSHKLRETFV